MIASGGGFRAGSDFEEFHHFEHAVLFNAHFEGVALAALDVWAVVFRRDKDGHESVAIAISGAHQHAEEAAVRLPPALVEAVIDHAFELVDVAAQRARILEVFVHREGGDPVHGIDGAVEKRVNTDERRDHQHEAEEMRETDAGLSATGHEESGQEVERDSNGQ